jgi:hypothetical protein
VVSAAKRVADKVLEDSSFSITPVGGLKHREYIPATRSIPTTLSSPRVDQLELPDRMPFLFFDSRTCDACPELAQEKIKLPARG